MCVCVCVCVGGGDRETGKGSPGCFFQKLKTFKLSDPTERKQILRDIRVHLSEVDYTFQDARGPSSKLLLPEC